MSEINPEIKSAIEAIIFISERPIPAADIQNILDKLTLINDGSLTWGLK